jgi:hypothetical protein
MYASIPIAAMQDRSWPGTKGRLARELRHECVCLRVCATGRGRVDGAGDWPRRGLD